jgi:hypothetical protein
MNRVNLLRRESFIIGTKAIKPAYIPPPPPPPPPAPIFNLTVDKLTADEGDDLLFTVSGSNVLNSTTVVFQVTGDVTPSDFTQGSFVGSIGMSNNTGSYLFKIKNDAITDGDKTMTLTLSYPLLAQGLSETVLIKDTSKAPPAYNIVVNTPVNEPGTIIFTINTIGVPDGTVIPYQISGTANSNDFSTGGTGNLAGGTVIISADSQPVPVGSATVTFVVKADLTTEGIETIRLSIPVGSLDPSLQPVPLVDPHATARITDTSVTPDPIFSLSLDPSVVNETTNNQVTATLTSTYASNGTIVPFKITGVSSNDFSPSLVGLSGLFVISGPTPPTSTPIITTKVFSISADKLTETGETLTMRLTSVGSITCPPQANGVSDSILVQDTSLSPTFLGYLYPKAWPEFHLDLSDPNSTYHFAVPVGGGTSISSTTQELAKPLADGQNVHAIIRNNLADTDSIAQYLLTDVGGTLKYETNSLGTSKPGLRIRGSGSLISNFLTTVGGDYIGDLFGPTKSLTCYMVFKSVHPLTDPYMLVDFLTTINGTGKRIFSIAALDPSDGQMYQIGTSNSSGSSPIYVYTPATSDFRISKVIAVSIDGINNKVSYADNSGLFSPTEVTIAPTLIPSYSVAVSMRNNIAIGNGNAFHEFEVPEVKITSGYTNPAGLQTIINDMKAKWSIV